MSVEEEEGYDEEDEEEAYNENIYPDLLYGLYKKPTKAELVAGFPPRSLADRLMTCFLSSTEPSTGALCLLCCWGG